MSAAPSAILGECDTITIPTFANLQSSNTRPAFGEGGLHGRQNVEQRLLARLRLAAGFDRFDGVAEGRWEIRAVRGDLLAQRKEKRAVKRAGGAPHFHNKLRADRLQRFRQRLLRRRLSVGPHRLEASLHVDPMIAVAHRLIEGGQFVGMGDYVIGHGDDQAAQKGWGHARTLSPAASKKRGLVSAMATSSPGPSPESGSARVMKSRSPRSTCK